LATIGNRFPAVRLLKQPIRGGDEFFVGGKIVRLERGPTVHSGKDRLLMRQRQGVVIVDESSRGAAHRGESTLTMAYIAMLNRQAVPFSATAILSPFLFPKG
jgi:hypothetical protein